MIVYIWKAEQWDNGNRTEPESSVPPCDRSTLFCHIVVDHNCRVAAGEVILGLETVVLIAADDAKAAGKGDIAVSALGDLVLIFKIGLKDTGK